MEYYEASVRAQEEIDKKLFFDDSADIKADADTGLSTIGLKNIWAVINTATIGKAYQEVPTVWQRISKKASVPNFLKHTVHRAKLVGRYERLDRIGGEPPHATYMEDHILTCFLEIVIVRHEQSRRTIRTYQTSVSEATR